MRDDNPTNGQVLIEDIGLPCEDVVSALKEALILSRPGVPTRTGAIRRLNRTLTIRNRVRGIRNIALRRAFIAGVRFLKGELFPTSKKQIAANSLFRRPMIGSRPFVRA